MAYKCLRFCVFFFNILFFLSGGALCGYGIYLRVDEDDYADICEQYSWANAANLCIAAGALVFFIAAFGCIGAAMKSSALLGIFFFFLLLIFIMELAAGVLAFVYRTEVIDEAEICLNGTLDQAVNGKESLLKAWKAVQDEFNCCGVRGVEDWQGKTDHECSASHEQDGCLDKFEDKSREFLLVIGGLCLGLTLIEILGMILSLSLILKINKEKTFSPQPKEDYGKF